MPDRWSDSLVEGAPLMVVGEAFAETEAVTGSPLTGRYGHALFQLFRNVGLKRADLSLTNVFNERPPGDVISRLWEDDEIREAALQRLGKEIDAAKPNCILAMGNTALRALTGLTGVSSIRGHCLHGTLRPVKVLPTLLSIFQGATARANVQVDIIKAKRESAFPEVRHTHKTLWLEPSLPDLLMFEEYYIESASYLACDIETSGSKLITMVGLAPRPSLGIVVPFVDKSKPSWHYWETREEEIAAWAWLRRQLTRPIPKIFQNGQYDIFWLSHYGIYPTGPLDDTMLLHHARYSELQKDLESLAAVYAHTPPWKSKRPRGQDVGKEK